MKRNRPIYETSFVDPTRRQAMGHTVKPQVQDPMLDLAKLDAISGEEQDRDGIDEVTIRTAEILVKNNLPASTISDFRNLYENVNLYTLAERMCDMDRQIGLTENVNEELGLDAEIGEDEHDEHMRYNNTDYMHHD